MANMAKVFPAWDTMPSRPGLYLSLSHGRDFPQQVMKMSGFAGPKIGPLLYVEVLYIQRITLRFASKRDAARYFPDAEAANQFLEVVEGTVVFGGKCYGRWDVCNIDAEYCLTPRLKPRKTRGPSSIRT